MSDKQIYEARKSMNKEMIRMLERCLNENARALNSLEPIPGSNEQARELEVRIDLLNTLLGEVRAIPL